MSRQAVWARSKHDRERQERLVWKALCHLAGNPIIEIADRPLDVTTELRRRGLAIGTPNDYLGGVWVWNDAPERTHAEVLAAFDKAIAAA